MKNIKTSNKIVIITSLIAIAVGWRIINHSYSIAPNLELVTVVSVIAAITMGIRFGLIVPLTTIVLSDLIIGNTSIFIFTWSAFALIGVSATLLKKLNNKPKSQILASVGFAAISSFSFFVITNFGVWAQGWYPATMVGLVDCFVAAIPFYRTMLIGNLILVPAAVSVWQLVRVYQTNKESVVDTLVRQ